METIGAILGMLSFVLIPVGFISAIASMYDLPEPYGAIFGNLGVGLAGLFLLLLSSALMQGK